MKVCFRFSLRFYFAAIFFFLPAINSGSFAQTLDSNYLILKINPTQIAEGQYLLYGECPITKKTTTSIGLGFQVPWNRSLLSRADPGLFYEQLYGHGPVIYVGLKNIYHRLNSGDLFTEWLLTSKELSFNNEVVAGDDVPLFHDNTASNGNWFLVNQHSTIVDLKLSMGYDSYSKKRRTLSEWYLGLGIRMKFVNQLRKSIYYNQSQFYHEINPPVEKNLFKLFPVLIFGFRIGFEIHR